MGNIAKKLALAALISVVTLGIFCLLLCWWCGRWNLDLPFGYYGEFNRVKSELKRVPEVQIVSTGMHKDLSLEDFWFGVQTESGLNLSLEFWDHHKTDELFEHADGLLVQNPGSGKRLHYVLASGERLETSTGQEIRNAVDVLKNFDKIAAVIDADRHKGLAEIGWEKAAKNKNCFWIVYPVH